MGYELETKRRVAQIKFECAQQELILKAVNDRFKLNLDLNCFTERGEVEHYGRGVKYTTRVDPFGVELDGELHQFEPDEVCQLLWDSNWWQNVLAEDARKVGVINRKRSVKRFGKPKQTIGSRRR